MKRLTGLDAGFLYMETPSLHMHTLKMAVFDPPPGYEPTFEEMRETIGRRLALLPPLRRRMVEVPLRLHHPVWIEDPDFDLDYHVRRVVLPSPGTRRQLDEAVGDIAGLALDRNRPLWRLHIFEGLEDGSTAALVKVHHAVADGVAASFLLANALATSPDDLSEPDDGGWMPEEVPSNRQLLSDALKDHVRQALDLPSLLIRTFQRIWSLLMHRRATRQRSPLPLVHTPNTSFNSALTPHRSFATTSFAFEEIRTVKNAFGVTVNDVVLALVGGSLREYLAERDELPDWPLIAGVPVSADTNAIPRLAGNKVSNMFTTLATDEPDPLARLRTIHEVTAEAKEVQRLIGADTLAAWVQYTPPGAYSWVMRQYSRRRIADHHRPPMNAVVSNVPGPREPLYIAGAPLKEIYSVGPILEGIGLNITVWSYCDKVYVGVIACREAMPDAHAITEGMRRALDELVQLAGRPAMVGSGTGLAS